MHGLLTALSPPVTIAAMPVQPSLFEPAPDSTGAAPSPMQDARLLAARLHGLLRELTLLNNEIPVIVEGRRDVAALRRLGLKGTITTLHCGQTVAAFCEQITRRYPCVILLLDWDRRGRQLHTQLTLHLEAEWEEHNYVRQELISLCKTTISSIEDLPALLEVYDAPSPSLSPRGSSDTGDTGEAGETGRQPIP
jgi:5S rRNA maturation endonuclease (ribonuclease M5)